MSTNLNRPGTVPVHCHQNEWAHFNLEIILFSFFLLLEEEEDDLNVEETNGHVIFHCFSFFPKKTLSFLHLFIHHHHSIFYHAHNSHQSDLRGLLFLFVS